MTRAKRISAVPVFIIVLAGWLLTGCDDVESTTELRAEPQSHVTAASDINIIYILTDDQRFDELGFMNPVIDTPNIDRLAQEGVHFKNAFVTTALCSPSRATILTGQYMHNHGVVDNNAPPNPDSVFFLSLIHI